MSSVEINDSSFVFVSPHSPLTKVTLPMSSARFPGFSNVSPATEAVFVFFSIEFYLMVPDLETSLFSKIA